MPFFRCVRSCGLLWLLLCLAAVLPYGPSNATAQDASKQAAVRDFNAAAALQNSGFYARAAEKWAAFVQKYPNDPRLDRVHYYLGICRLHTKSYAEAVKTFETVITKYPGFSGVDGAQYNLGMARFQIATASKKADDFKTAATALGTVAEKYPSGKYAHKALYFQGEALYSAGDLKAAAEPYKKLIANFSGSSLLADAYYALGTTQQELGLDGDAATTLKAFLDNAAFANHELADEVRLRLGMSLFRQKSYGEAEKLFAAVAAVQDFPGADFALLRQAQCRLETDKAAEAAALFSDLLKRFPNSQYKAAAQLAMGKCCFLTDKLDDAQKAFLPLVGANLDESAEAAYWLGRTLLKMKKPQDALKVLEDAVGKFTTGEFVPHLQLARADALYDLPERRKETVPLYENFAKQHPDHPLAAQAVYMAALAALGEEDYAAACRHAAAFLANAKFADHELTPVVLYIAGEGYLLPADTDQGGGDLAKAEGFYRQLVDKYPQHQRAPRGSLRIGWCLFQAKRYDESLKYLTDVVGKLKDAAHVAEAQLLIGRNQSTAGRHAEAVQAYDAAWQAKSDWSRADEVLIAAAASLRALDQLDAAAERLKRLNDGFPQSTYRAQALYQLGEISQEQKKHDEAINHYQQCLQQSPQGDFVAPAHYGLGAACFAKQDYGNALSALEKLLAGNPEADVAARGRYLRGLVYQRQKKFTEAAADLQAFLDTKPSGDEVMDARSALVLCRIGLKQFPQAAAEMAALLQQKPDYAHADKVYYELGHAQLGEKQTQEAATAFRTLAEKFPNSPLAAESWFHVGRAHEEAAQAGGDESQKQAELSKAAGAYAAGVAQAKQADLHEKLQYKLGDVQFRQKQYDQAAATLQAQIGKHPGGNLVGPARFLAAESLFRQDKFDQALPLFVQVANDKVDKYHAQSLYRAGTCAANAKSWAESQKHYEALITQFPKFEQISEARYGLGFALQNQQKLDEAGKIYEQITSETETETAAKARFMIGEIAFAGKKYEDAIEQYLLVAVGYPYPEWQALARFEAGRCFISLGETDKAIASLQIVVDKFPNHPKAQDAAKLIAELKSE